MLVFKCIKYITQHASLGPLLSEGVLSNHLTGFEQETVATEACVIICTERGMQL